MKIKANGIDIEVDDTGSGPAVLLIMGLGMQLVGWPKAFVHALVNAGFRVIRHDNRDSGLSKHFKELGVPNMLWAMTKARLGLPLRAPYGLQDMARDSVGVLDALGVKQAHVIGASMGGMIAQHIALIVPDRVASLTSIMSSSGAPGLPSARPDVLRALFSHPESAEAEHLIEHAMLLYRLIASPDFPTGEAELRERVLEAARRSYNPSGTSRQMLAIAADRGRAPRLASIRAPTLVLHGKADPLVPLACGEDTARRIPGARFVAIDGMGHDLAPGLIPRLIEQIVPHLATASPQRETRPAAA